MDKYLEMCNYILSKNVSLNRMTNIDAEWCRKVTRSYLKGISVHNWIGDTHAVISRYFTLVVAFNKDWDIERKIKGYSQIDKPPSYPWNKTQKGKAVNKDGDFYSMDISFFFSHFTDVDGVVKENVPLMKRTALRMVADRLEKREIPLKLLEVKRVIWRKNFDEVIVTVGLRKDLLELKEKMRKELQAVKS